MEEGRSYPQKPKEEDTRPKVLHTAVIHHLSTIKELFIYLRKPRYMNEKIMQRNIHLPSEWCPGRIIVG